MAGFGISSCRRNDAVESEKLVAQTAKNTAQLQTDLATKFKEDRDSALRDNSKLERANERLERDRDRLNDRLSTLEQRANIQVQTNAPSDKRVDSILEQLKLLGPSAFDFGLYVNGVEVKTNGQEFVIDVNSGLKFSAKNLSTITVEHLTVQFAPYIDPVTLTNFSLRGWKTRCHIEWDPALGPKVPVIETKAEMSIAAGDSFVTDLITATNHGAFKLRAQVSVHADRAIKRQYIIELDFK